jgi:hypothetical protein
MSIFSFVKEAGEKLLDLLTPGNANASEQLKEHISKVGLVTRMYRPRWMATQ